MDNTSLHVKNVFDKNPIKRIFRIKFRQISLINIFKMHHVYQSVKKKIRVNFDKSFRSIPKTLFIIEHSWIFLKRKKSRIIRLAL